jgi:hypothetical protein
MVQHIATLVKKYGHCDVPPIARRQPGVYSVICQGCGKKISTSDNRPIDYVISKRGTAMFWHTECFDKAATNKILWKED